MSRYKSRQSVRTTELDYPHFVDMVVPPGGLGNRLDAMYDWHRLYSIRPQRGRGRHDANLTIIRWCFAERPLAEEFALEFGGSPMSATAL